MSPAVVSQFAQHVTGGGEAETGGHRHRGAESACAVEAAGGSTGWFLCRDAALAVRIDQAFLRIERGNAETARGILRKAVLLAQPFAGLGQQWILPAAGQVANGEFQRVGHATRAAYGDDRQPLAAAMGEQCRLGAKVVDAIDDPVVAAVEDVGDIVGRDEVVDDMGLTIGVDGSDPLTQGFGLGLAERLGGGVQLAIDVGFGDMIHIDQGEFANGAAGQRFDGPGTHAAETEHADMGVAKAGQRFSAIDAGDAAKTSLGIGCPGFAGHGCF